MSLDAVLYAEMLYRLLAFRKSLPPAFFHSFVGKTFILKIKEVWVFQS